MQKKKGVAFLHVPKTGGTFVSQAETDGVPVVSPITYLGHVNILDGNADLPVDLAKPYGSEHVLNRDGIDQYFIFSNVRNIFELLVSYLYHAGGLNPKYRDTSHYDFEAANRGFDYLLRSIADREELWPSRRFIHHMLFAQPSGDFLPEWLNYVGVLDFDLERMAAHFGLKYQKRAKQRSNNIQDYRTYYTDQLVALVEETWKRELDLFGFAFSDRSVWIGREKVMPLLRGAKYIWRTDTFTPAG